MIKTLSNNRVPFTIKSSIILEKKTWIITKHILTSYIYTTENKENGKTHLSGKLMQMMLMKSLWVMILLCLQFVVVIVKIVAAKSIRFIIIKKYAKNVRFINYGILNFQKYAWLIVMCKIFIPASHFCVIVLCFYVLEQQKASINIL